MKNTDLYSNEEEGLLLSTDKSKLDINMIHTFLSSETYWAKGITKAIVTNSILNSLCFGLYYNHKQIGFARVISDYATIAYLGDVFILNEHRKKGYSKILVEQVMKHPELQGLRRWILLTSDAHDLYSKYGWKSLSNTKVWMEINNPKIYQSK